MRYLVTTIVLIAFTAIAAYSDYIPFNIADEGIRHIVQSVSKAEKLSKEEENDLIDKLREKALADPNIQSAITFAEVANNAYKWARGNSGLLELVRSSSGDQVTNDMRLLESTYRGKGILPSVRYANLSSREKVEKLIRLTSDHGGIDSCEDLTDIYNKARRQGCSPDKAYEKVQKYCDETGDIMSGLRILEGRLQAFGEFALTGYNRASAAEDVGHFLESHYAYTNSRATDIKGVVPAYDPYDYVSNKANQAMRDDLYHVMKPVNAYIRGVLYPEVNTPPTPQQPDPNLTPNFDDLRNTNRTTGGMPSWEQMPRPPSLMQLVTYKPAKAGYDPAAGMSYTPEGNNSHWTGHSWYSLDSPADIEKKWWCEKYGIYVVKFRQHHSDGLRRTGCRFHGEPNKLYLVIFNAWYWSESNTRAYFSDGSNATVEPPENRRTYIKPSSGEVIKVHFYVKSDSKGTGTILFSARGRCALAINEFYHVLPVKAPASTAKK